jgi:ATP-dependent RNA helicase SUPV3L1/SUV3
MKARGELEDSELNPSRPSMTADKLSEIIASRLIALSTSLEDSQRLDAIGIDKATFQKQWSRLKSQVLSRLVNKQDPIGSEFEEEYTINGNQGVEAKLRYLFFDKVFRNKENPSVSNLESQNSVADYRYPGEHFFGARPMKRSIHLHVGPTNSGKTYQALKRLEAVGDGVYAGPLRLLAHEVYSRLNAKGIPCNLITGEERRVHSHIQTGKTSCTVEMVSLNTQLDVAVIDEIQMMSDPARGWAWTEAFLGVRASELHLCGEERVVPLVKELAAMMGEEVTVHTYERLSPLQVQDSSIHGDLTSLRKGDCVICFSRREIHALKANIEIITRKRCAIVYGGLPPESRAQQAKLFNDPNNDYDILVASDAVGMGLNL